MNKITICHTFSQDTCNTFLKSINLHRTLEINFSNIDDVLRDFYLLLPSKLCCIQHKIKIDNKFTNISSDKQLTDFFRTVPTALCSPGTVQTFELFIAFFY